MPWATVSFSESEFTGGTRTGTFSCVNLETRYDAVAILFQFNRLEESFCSPIMKPGQKVAFQVAYVRSGRFDRPADCVAHRLASDQSAQELVRGQREFVVADHVLTACDCHVGFDWSGKV